MALILPRVHIIFTLLSFEYLPIKWKCSVPPLRQCKTKHVFFIYKKKLLFESIRHQNGRVWAGGRKTNVEPHRLLVEGEKLPLMSSCRPESASVEKGILCRWEGEGNVCKTGELKIVNIHYRSSSKTVLQLTRHASHRTGWSQTAATSSPRTPRISAPQFTLSQYNGLSRLGAMLESYHKLQPEPKQ